ncbi:putative pectate lyase 2 [Lycium barbarum]|uniref:putative pectate lyase 2 n=1 Tax=Lycium barbarum TaxID=112863 RepID=UPI00293E0CD4|nr:putative pectate lyase 2 [Lycium barbarum]
MEKPSFPCLVSWLLLFSIYSLHVKAMNVIDSCWRSDPKWSTNRKALGNCAKGFGSSTMGGKNGAFYIVNDASDDPVNPKQGTLRYGVIQTEPLWIIFQKNMLITLKNELIISAYKTIDGRGAKVEIAYGPCFTIQLVKHVIVHGISLRDCKAAKPGPVRVSPTRVLRRSGTDGDAITIHSSSKVWIDHCYFARADDGLIDVVHGSTSVTVSNNYLTQHNKVMLLGNQDGLIPDKKMRVTIAFNHFGPGLHQRMPMVRLGYAHVANNYYEPWNIYAIGGASNPTIFSEGNYFIAGTKKEVTHRNIASRIKWEKWNWKSSKDAFTHGAFFKPSGSGSANTNYTPSQLFSVAQGSQVPSLTSDVGPLNL